MTSKSFLQNEDPIFIKQLRMKGGFLLNAFTFWPFCLKISPENAKYLYKSS